MINCKKTLFFTFLMSISLSHQANAIGEGLSKVVSGAGEVADDVGDMMGIGLTATEINANADKALKQLLQTSPAASELSKTAKGILIYPEILKAGIGIGGQHGEGALQENGTTVAYYNTVAASYGLQLGAQSFGFAMFFMNDEALEYLKSSKGWEVGVGPSVVMVDKGMAKTLTTSTAKDSIYVFTFNQQGLMAGMGIQGSKITKINPDK